MGSILVVCTGNICRSPVAEGFLRRLLVERLGDRAPEVSSVGLSGWEGSPAHPDSVRAALDWEVDISSHVARRMLPEHTDGPDLILAMAEEHAEGAFRLSPESVPRLFTLKELVRLLEALPPADSGRLDDDAPRERIRAAHHLRHSGFQGNRYDQDVSDPLGMPTETFRAVAWEIHQWSQRLVDGLYGKVPAPSPARVPDK
jgi:protein-tyrosine phosphatase